MTSRAEARADFRRRLLDAAHHRMAAHGAASATAEARCHEAMPRAAWVAVWLAVQAWARVHPHEYALIYGPPSPGTARRRRPLNLLLAGIAADLPVSGPPGGRTAGRGTRQRRAARIRDWLAAEELATTHVPDAAILAVARALSTLIGAIGLELFGHFKGGFHNPQEFLEHAARHSFTELRRAMGHIAT